MVSISATICDLLTTQIRIQEARIILAYLSFGSEVDLRDLCRAFPEKTWGMPRCLPDYTLSWHQYDPKSPETVPNRWGISEPYAEDPALDPAQADLILVPALACDRWGHRLGYGAGFYDRFLQQVQIPSLGVIPQACFLSDPLPRDRWDIPLQAVVTERGVNNSTSTT
jgi:5-formyltetrahydrofolate cyclo-ligase